MGDVDECPPLAPGGEQREANSSVMSSSDHRFSVRQIQFNLITSLAATPNNRSSFISRASNRLGGNKMNYSSSNSSQMTNRNGRCSHKCTKGFKNIFNCCNAYNATSRSKFENTSVYSNGSAFNKVLMNNNVNNGSSFA